MSPPAKKMAKPPAATSAQVAATAPLQHKRIARLAYAYWEARGHPHGSPEEDWFRAEEDIRRRKAGWKIVKDPAPPGAKRPDQLARPQERWIATD